MPFSACEAQAQFQTADLRRQANKWMMTKTPDQTSHQNGPQVVWLSVKEFAKLGRLTRGRNPPTIGFRIALILVRDAQNCRRASAIAAPRRAWA